MDLPAELAARFQIGDLLGRGAFGAVYRATASQGGPEFALKVLDEGHDPERLAREVEALRRLRHPHVLRCLAAGPGWLALELAGDTGEELWTDAGRVDEAWGALIAAARGAAALHGAGVAHRDLKPENLLRVGERWVVADLGLAKLADLETLTKTGMIQGTPTYMAPEQALGKKPGPAADAWALGIMAYQLLEGRTPWPTGDSPIETLMRIARGERPAWRRGPTRISAACFAAVQAALEPDPEDRPRDLAAWAEVLDREGPPGEEAPPEREPDGNVTQMASSVSATVVHGAAPVEGTLVAPVGPSPASTPAPASTGRGRIGLVAVLAIGVVVAGASWLRAPAKVTVTGAGPQGEVAALIEGISGALVRLEADYAADREGRLVQWTPEATGLFKVREVSPLEYPAVEEAFPDLVEWRRRLGEGLRPEDLPAKVRARMVEVDAGFYEAGLPRPFQAVLVEPVAEPVELESEFRAALLADVRPWTGQGELPPTSGWMGAGVQALREAWRFEVERGEYEAAVLRGEGPGRRLPDWVVTQIHDRHDGGSIRMINDRNSALRALVGWLPLPQRAARSWRLYRDEQAAHDRAGYALARSLETEPETRLMAAALLLDRLWDPRPLSLHPLRFGQRIYPAWLPPEGPARAFAETHGQWLNDRTHQLVKWLPPSEPEAVRRRGPGALALLRTLFTGPKADPLAGPLCVLLNRSAIQLWISEDDALRDEAMALSAGLLQGLERGLSKLRPWEAGAVQSHLLISMDRIYEKEDVVLDIHRDLGSFLVRTPLVPRAWEEARPAWERMRQVLGG